MALIPNTQKFHTVAGALDTENKGSAQLNAKRQAFTMQDIADTVGGLEGDFSVYVKADGTPQENGAALLAAYTEAANKVIDITTITNKSFVYDGSITIPNYGLAFSIGPTPFSNYPYGITVGYEWTGTTNAFSGGERQLNFKCVGFDPSSRSYLYIQAFELDGTQITSGPDDDETFPFPYFNITPATLLIGTGKYEIPSDLIVNDFVNITSLSGLPDVYISGGDIKIQSGANSSLANITIQGIYQADNSGSGFLIGSNLSWITYKNIISLDDYAFNCDGAGFLNGTFEDCKGGVYSFGEGAGVTVLGEFYRCEAYRRSFGYQVDSIGSTAYFKNCGDPIARVGESVRGSYNLFGDGVGSISARFEDCVCVEVGNGTSNWFGNSSDFNAGRYINCAGPNDSFGKNSTNEKGYYKNCIGGSGSFEHTSTVSTSGSLGAVYHQCVVKSSDSNQLLSGFSTGSGKQNIIGCSASTYGTIGDNSVAYNCQGSNFAVSGTGKVRNCLDTSTNTIVNLG